MIYRNYRDAADADHAWIRAGRSRGGEPRGGACVEGAVVGYGRASVAADGEQVVDGTTKAGVLPRAKAPEGAVARGCRRATEAGAT